VESAQKAGTAVEVIVIDNGSVDETAAVCKQLSGIRYIRLDHNRGVDVARNVGILASAAEFVSFLDDDDLRLPGSLDRQVDVLRAEPTAGFVYGPVLLGDHHCTPTGAMMPIEGSQGDVFWKLLEWNFVPLISPVVRKSCFAYVGMFDPTVPRWDWDLWLRLAARFPVAVTEEPVAIYRVPTPLSGQETSNPAPMLMQAARTYDRWLQLRNDEAACKSKQRAARRRFLNRASDALIFAATDFLKVGVPQTARENLMAALRLNPFRAARPWTFELLMSSLMGGPRRAEPSHPESKIGWPANGGPQR
jgi:glycosyltransferase involved in cell wall biosynthesis